MLPRLCRASRPAIVALVAACSDGGESTAPLRPTPLQQDQAGSSATVAGFTYFVTSTLANAPNVADPLLRPTITTTVRMRNDRQGPVTVNHGACSVTLTAFRTSDRQGTPAWKSGSAEPWEGTYGRGCILILIQKTLAPGEELTFGYSSRVIEILGDSLPNGRYYLTATVLAGGVAAGGVLLPAGEMQLDLARPPLPSSLTYGLVTYNATTTLAGGTNPTVQARVTGTLTHAGGSLLKYPRDCPVELVAYRSKERRDTAPRSGAPDWRAPRSSCSTDWQDVILNRGESKSFETTASARDILGSALPEGTYYFAVVLRTRTRDVWLAAGDGMLRR